MDFSGCVGSGLGGNCDCRCGILYAPMLGGWYSLKVANISLKTYLYSCIRVFVHSSV